MERIQTMCSTSTQSDSSCRKNQMEPTSFSLLLCSAGMFMRNKFIIWLSIFFIISTMCRKKYSSPSTRYLVNEAMIIFGLATNYVLHLPQ